MNRLISILLAALMGLVIWNGVASAAQAYSKQKVVNHINGDDPKQQAGALRNIQNHINAVGAGNLELRVVMHGNGVSLVLLPDALPLVPKFKQANATEQLQATIDGLRNQGIRESGNQLPDLRQHPTWAQGRLGGTPLQRRSNRYLAEWRGRAGPCAGPGIHLHKALSNTHGHDPGVSCSSLSGPLRGLRSPAR